MTERDALQVSLGDRYRLERELGSGGMSTVYLAHDEKRGSRVALKVLLPELSSAVGADRFLREIRIASKLGHPHILPLYESGQAGEHLYYTMPYVEGETLRVRLDREGQLGIETSLQIAKQVAGALHHAHGQGVVHRDIKPENILLTEGGAVVMDFGIARAGGERLTETGLAMGTPAYMSSEQAEGRERVDGRSDQYSLACVLYEMLAGHPPFGGPTSQVVLSRAAKDPVPPLSSARRTVSVPVEAVIHKALSKVAADRFASAEELGKALELAEQGVTPRGVTPSSVTPSGETPGGITPWSVPYRTTVWTELARRRVYQVAVSYLVVAWALVQVADATFESLGLPATAQTWLIWGLIGGFPVAVLLAWVYELTPRGIRRTQAVGVTPGTGTRPAPRPRLALTLGVAAVGVTGSVAYLAGREAATPSPSTELRPFPRDADLRPRAVIPFRVSDGLEQYRTGLVDLLLPRFNTRDIGPEAAAIRAAWRAIAGADTADVDARRARLIAREVDAPWMVYGSLIETPRGLTLSADLVWVETGKAYGTATIETSEQDLTRALAILQASLVGGAPVRILEETPTEAIEEYNAGIVAGRDLAVALPHFERAVQIDSTFGSAAYELFYAYQNLGRIGEAKERARNLAWSVRDRMAVPESLYQIIDGNFGPGGPGSPRLSGEERFELLSEMTEDNDAPWEIWSLYMAFLGEGRPNWRRRAINAANRTIETMPPTAVIAPWVHWVRYELGMDAREEFGDSLVYEWGREWTRRWASITADWMLAARWREWDTVRDLLAQLHRQNMFAGQADEWRAVDQFVDESANYGHPPDLGAEQAVRLAVESAVTEDDRRVAVHARARLALLQGRFAEAAALYDTLQAIGSTRWQWMARSGGLYAALGDPGFRSAGVDFGAPFFAVRDTAAVPESWSTDNPADRLCGRDLWDVIVRGDLARPSKAQAQPDTRSSRRTGDADGTSTLVSYERGYCEAIARAVVDEGTMEGDSPSPGLVALASRPPPNGSGGKLTAIFAARLLASRGEFGQALETLGSFPEWVNGFNFFDFVPVVMPYLALEGTLAAKTGDGERATRAFEHYLTLRTKPDEFARPEVDAVCAELRTVAGDEAAERFATCR